MTTQNAVADTFTLSGSHESRLAQLLQIAQHQARLVEGAAGPHLRDALVDLEEVLSGQLAALANAADDDRADAEYSGDAERERQAWRPQRAA